MHVATLPASVQPASWQRDFQTTQWKSVVLLLRVFHVCVFIILSLRSSTDLLCIIVVNVILAFVRVAVHRLHRSVDLDTCIYVVVGFTYCFRRLTHGGLLWINYLCRDGEQVQRGRLQKRLWKLCRSRQKNYISQLSAGYTTAREMDQS